MHDPTVDVCPTVIPEEKKPIEALEAANRALCSLVMQHANDREITRCSRCFGRGHLGRTIVNIHDQARPTGLLLCRCMKRVITPAMMEELMAKEDIIPSSFPKHEYRVLSLLEIAERKLQTGIAYGITF